MLATRVRAFTTVFSVAVLACSSCSSGDSESRVQVDATTASAPAPDLGEDAVEFATLRDLAGETHVSVVGQADFSKVSWRSEVAPDGTQIGRLAFVDLRVESIVFAFEEGLTQLGVKSPQLGSTLSVAFPEKSLPRTRESQMIWLFATWNGNQGAPGFVVADQGFAAFFVDSSERLLPVGDKSYGMNLEVGLPELAKQAAAVQSELVTDYRSAMDRDMVLADLLATTSTELSRHPSEGWRWQGNESLTGVAIAPVAPESALTALCVLTLPGALSDSCDVPTPVSTQTSDGSISLVEGRHFIFAGAKQQDCAKSKCAVVAFDLAARQVFVLHEGEFNGVDGETRPLVPPSRDEVPITEELDAFGEPLSKTNDGAGELWMVTLNASGATFYAIACEGPENMVAGCDRQTARPLIAAGQSVQFGIVEVPKTCDDDCRVVVVDATDTGRRAIVGLND